MAEFQLAVTDALIAFRDALVALAPIADRVGIPWHDDQATDEWDAVTKSLYAAVIGNMANDGQNGESPAAPLAPYDLTLPNFEGVSWLELSADAGQSDRLAFLGLTTNAMPFDTAEFSRVAPDLTNAGWVSLPFSEVEVALRRQLGDGRSELATTIRFAS